MSAQPAETPEGPAGDARRFDKLSDRSRPVPEPAEGTGQERTGKPVPPVVLVAVFVAGVLGTAARLAIDVALPGEPGGIPLSTLLINTVGSFLLGILVAALPHRTPEWVRAALTTGFLGSFTTFSAITVAAVGLTGSGLVPSTVMLLTFSVVAGVAAAVAGMALGAAVGRRRV